MQNNNTINNDVFTVNAETNADVLRHLTSAYRCGNRVRVYYGDAETGADWCEEYDTVGRVGRSTGQQAAPLLVKNSRSLGGSAILTHCIVKLVNLDSGITVYTHPLYRAPRFTADKTSDADGRFKVYRIKNGMKEHAASLPSYEAAQRYILFMIGARNAKGGVLRTKKEYNA